MSANLVITRVTERASDASSDASSDALLALQSDLLGALRVPADATFAFADGIFGFPECRRFALVAAGREGLYWLQSLDHSALTFLLVDPFRAFPGFTVDIGPLDRAALGPADAADVAVLCIVTLPRTRDEQPTANLQGPVALDCRRRYGRQLALGETEWGMRRPFALDGDAAA